MIYIKGINAAKHMEALATKLQLHPNDAGIDIFPSGISRIERLNAHKSQLYVGTGIHIVVPEWTFGMLCGRSSTVKRLSGYGDVITSVIDCGFTGELLVRVVFETLHESKIIGLIERMAVESIAIAQLIVTAYMEPKFIEWDEDKIATLGRGDKGFGSTDGLTSESEGAKLEQEVILVPRCPHGWVLGEGPCGCQSPSILV
jgi:dUTPase